MASILAAMESANNKYPRKVYLVEDSPPVRSRMAAVMKGIDGISVAGEAATPRGAIDGILATSPDVVLLDLHLEGGNGLEVLQAVHPQRPDVVFIVLTNHPTDGYARQCLMAGASHFLDKTYGFETAVQIVTGLRGVPRCH